MACKPTGTAQTFLKQRIGPTLRWQQVNRVDKGILSRSVRVLLTTSVTQKVLTQASSTPLRHLPTKNPHLPCAKEGTVESSRRLEHPIRQRHEPQTRAPGSPSAAPGPTDRRPEHQNWGLRPGSEPLQRNPGSAASRLPEALC